MADANGITVRAGVLLVATPALVDPNFQRSVVLVLDHDENGALGVVLDRPSPVPVGDVLSDWAEHVAKPGVLFHGGPVSTDSALAVALLPPGAEEEPLGFRRLFEDTGSAVGIVDLDTPAQLLGAAVSGMRIFAGYAGWGESQLDAEIEEGSWYVVPASATDPFTADPQRLWGQVLRRQPGELAWVSTRPVDATQN